MQIVSADQLLLQDLSKSGLAPADMDCYLATETELASCGIRPHLYLETPNVGTPGYILPYYNIQGQRAPFYRLRLFSPLPKGAKYLQPSNSGSWIYYPRTFMSLMQTALKGQVRTKHNGFPAAILVTEGEKKAAAGCKFQFPTCAVAGVWNWRMRTITLPEGTQLMKNRDNEIIAKIEKGQAVKTTSDNKAFLATGLEDLMQLIFRSDLQVVFVFDSDNPRNVDVEAACAELAFEFRIYGIPTTRIRQLRLPASPGSKMGLDDFLVQFGAEALDKLLEQVVQDKSAFPAHPNLRDLINKRLAGQLFRNEAKELTLLMLTDMDRHGVRMIEKGTNSPYFFDSRSKTLLRVNLLHHHQEPLHETKFGEFLYKNYDIGQADIKAVQWLASGFTGEEPVSQVDPRSTIALLSDNRVAHQLDDGHFCVVSGDPKMPVRICENGTEGTLFKADQVEPVDHKILMAEIKRQIAWLNSRPKYDEFYWPASLAQMKFARDDDAKIMACLAYMSPWLQRWNGAQLPVELMIGEPGSGKSTLYSLRLQILNGRPALRNQPTDLRDWYASITSMDGLHCVDNVHMVNKELRQRLSDEICRLVTEPVPYIEMRKLFTTSDNFRLPVRTVFAMTAIQQPFLNADILQRSLIFQLRAIGRSHVSDWAATSLTSRGGRIGWLAHHLAVLHVFFRRVQEGLWNANYRSNHRLANFEQIFRLMGSIIGVPNAEDIGLRLASVAEAQVSEYDWTMEGLKEYNRDFLHQQQKDPKFTFACQDIAMWAAGHEDYEENQTIINARRLSRYIESHKFMVEQAAGFIQLPNKVGNRYIYKLRPL